MKQDKEIAVVEMMIGMYCRGVHKSRNGNLCDECRELKEYVILRREKCPYGNGKPFCSNCDIHCYRPEMRARIRAVMRYAGSRIVFTHPVAAFGHLIESKKQAKKRKKEARRNVG